MRWRRRRPNGHDLTCQQAVALVTAYLDGELSKEARAAFEAHLADCEMCAEHLKQIRVTIAVAGRIRDEDLDQHLAVDGIDLTAEHPGRKDDGASVGVPVGNGAVGSPVGVWIQVREKPGLAKS
jgi:hypothetical protein